MIRLFSIIVLAGVVALAAAWVADHDTALILTVADYEIRTTVAVATVMLLAVFFALWLVLRILFALVRSLAKAGGHVSGRGRNAAAPPELPS
jgi:uncharacterized membrane-anchored protein